MTENAPTFIARKFHEAYESIAPSEGYETRTQSAVPWAEVPGPNRRLMERTVTHLIHEGIVRPGPAWTSPVDGS